jgi:hypothetical protein
MKTLLLTAAALVALTGAAQAGSFPCEGEVVVNAGWASLLATEPKADDDKSPDQICRFKANTPLGKRLLAKCPVGSICNMDLYDGGVGNHITYNHGVTIVTITKWPASGVERLRHTKEK